MNKKRSAWWWAFGFLALLLSGCEKQAEVERLPTARDAIIEVGKRLGRSRDPIALTAIATRGVRVLEVLDRAERWALGRNAIRFWVDRPVVVDVAAPSRSIPFWLADQEFVETTDRLRNSEGEFIVFRKVYPAGVVGLGVNSLDHTSRSHYAVFLRPTTPGTVRTEAIDPDPISRKLLRPDTSPFLDVEAPFESIPPDLLGSILIQTRYEDRHDAAIARGRVWKTRQPSGFRPDQIVVSFGEDSAHQLSITWRTDLTAKTSRVRIAVAMPTSDEPANPDTIQIFRGDDHPISSEGLLNDPTILRHRVLAKHLEPDTRYAYSVGDGSSQGWSDWRSIQTGPETPRDYGFLYLGDAQCGLERWGELLHTAHRRRPDAGFLLIAGDLVDRGNERSNWDHFFLRAAGVFDEIPFMPCVGNHEYLDKGPEIYQGTFDPPHNGPVQVEPNLVYSFEYSDAFVAVLDSNLGIHDSRLAQVQADWLDQELSKTKATWKFVTFHHPVYASHVSRENPQLGAVWGPIFDKHHVDMVLQGHDHAYLRTKPMREGRPVDSTSMGTVYVVSVSGEKFYEQDPRDYTAKGLTNLATYQTIDVKVKEKQLTYRSFDRDGREVDALIIDKGAEVPRLAGPIDR